MKTLPILLIPLFALSTAAFAQTAASPPKPAPAANGKVSFAAADGNHDGKLSRDEANAIPDVAAHFDAIDTDHDGAVSRDEFKAWRVKQHAGGKVGFATADANRDGKLSREEAKSVPDVAAHFDEMDTDHDGSVSRDEMKAWRVKQRTAGKVGFAAADANHDGKLSRDEAKAIPDVAAHFDEMDTDHDGNVSREEWRNWRKAQRAAGKPAPKPPASTASAASN